VELLSEAGIDVYSSQFWQGGFDVLEQMIGQLESLPIPE
jgi:oligoendopeptidase F